MSLGSVLGLSYKMLGVITVAKLWTSILDPFSSSIRQKDATQLKKESNTSANLKVSNGSGISLVNFLSNAASWIGVSLEKSGTCCGFESISSVSCLRRLMLPFMRNTPSTERSIVCITLMSSSTSIGTLSFCGPIPRSLSTPHFSTNSSNGQPKTLLVDFLEFPDPPNILSQNEVHFFTEINETQSSRDRVSPMSLCNANAAMCCRPFSFFSKFEVTSRFVDCGFVFIGTSSIRSLFEPLRPKDRSFFKNLDAVRDDSDFPDSGSTFSMPADDASGASKIIDFLASADAVPIRCF
ncbi:hypothetical protein OGATHE_004644 [Ogataea polymorpha]|uniref:Uncharacterized protein n=1 Tax=Ogataea polymorpha TaxID=460523 RepID=A0A9P8NZH6_9ASCO|nr:hypothetical protein OGATHE_004644 [Ogataea polymorpha]